ncbi:MAG: PhoH family protein [Candidatus Neomarinimicrobiota bacterium]|nr:MAG: phosphate starvation-inducible protein PhoH [Candidatus Marinimicrobia bacterium TMED108]RCL89435.1 MAG: PhoH family protein [bacterium]|tara:strand:+ start:2749 stop:3687 length:939 start_codon:yes stop_codon:yes gene_type:complete
MEKTIEMKGVDLGSFFGPADTNLKLIEKLFSSKIIARGNLIKIIGDEAEVDTISQVFHEMASTLNEKGSLEISDVETLLTFNSSAMSSGDSKSKYIIHYGRKGSIAARTKGQERYIEIARKNDIVFSTGPAGTGKTFLAVAFAVAALQNREVDKIILCRPAVEAGESLGFLPGDLKEKIDPYLRPLYDALGEILDLDKLKPLLFNNTIEIVPLAYMRGRTLNNAFMILDEAQNASSIQMKMFLTRLGVNSKTIITGDVTQTDLPKKIESGLIQVLNLLKDIDGVGFCNLSSADIVRHRLVKDIIQAYDNKKN